MKKLISIFLTMAMVFSMGTVAFADVTDQNTEKSKIAVGINAEFPPFEYFEDEELKGFDIDLMKYIGERTDLDFEFINMDFDKLITAVVNGEVDCAVSAITVTSERDYVIDYTTSYLKANVVYDGEESVENYAIVFPSNSKEKAILKEAAGDSNKSAYTLVDDAIKELIADGTIEKLIEKYELNSDVYYDETYSAEYFPGEVVEPNDNDTSAQMTVSAASDWAKESVYMAHNIGIAERADYNYIMPVTREEFCEMIYNLILCIKKEISAVHPNNYSDTSNRKMLVLAGLGIINGKSETELAPNDNLTREEAATIIVRMINKVVPMAATEMWFEYEDMGDISPWASDAVQTISNLGFMNGVGDNNFAPNATYTTEQAMATLVRVYESAKTNIDHSEDADIIGGADGTTSIIVGDNVNDGDTQDFEKFLEKLTQNTIKTDKFYTNEAIRLISESGKLAADRDYISLYTRNESITDKILAIGDIEFDKPIEIFRLGANQEKILANIKAMAGDEAENIDYEKMEKIYKRQNFSTLASLINSSYGAENLAALTVLTNSRGYVMPRDFKGDFALYVQYDGEYSAIVSFSKYGDGVISANMSFVRNGEKDNVFRRLYEIGSVVGEGGIIIEKVIR